MRGGGRNSLGLLVGAIVALLLPATASAQNPNAPPPCPPTSPPAMLPNLPPTLAVERSLDPIDGARRENPSPQFGALAPNPASDRSPWDTEISLQAADSAKPIAQPFGWTEDYYAPQITLAAGDGVAVVRWRITEWESDTGALCTREISQTLTPISGQLPLFRAQRTSKGVRISIRPCRQLSQTAVGGGSITVRQGKTRRTIKHRKDLCEGDFPNTGFYRGQWEMNGGFGRSVYVKPQFKEAGSRRFQFKASFEGQARFRGSFRVRTRVIGGVRINEGTDSFVNICINHPYPIKSDNGKLYCVIPGERRQRIKSLRSRHIGG